VFLLKNKILKIFIIVTLIISPLFFMVYYMNATVITTPMDTFFQKGICYATWQKDRFSSTYSDESLELLKKMGVEYVQINVTQYQDKYNSTKIKSTDLTPSDKSVRHVIKKAHALGLKVMLKPHIDLIYNEDDTYWRADIGFNKERDWKIWFKEYEDFIVHYAIIARKYNVEIFCVGTELSFTVQKTDYWHKIIDKIKEVYFGKLIYASNWDNYRNVYFWDRLDFVGIDAYFPLTYRPNPSVEEINQGWIKWKNAIEIWHKRVNKPIVFTEIGYASSLHAPSEPWKNGMGEADVEIQAKCYQSFFESIWDSSWLAGVYWWRWAPTTRGGGKYNRKFTPLNKPAAKILEKYYKTFKEKKKNNITIDISDNNLEYKEKSTLNNSSSKIIDSKIMLPVLKTSSSSSN